ncbi:hypothetical protein LTR39_006787, partial [Cryomyces antarcticus]
PTARSRAPPSTKPPALKLVDALSGLGVAGAASQEGREGPDGNDKEAEAEEGTRPVFQTVRAEQASATRKELDA